MNISPQDQAILLLTVSFGTNDSKKVKPLSTGEWSRFAAWLKEHELEPSSLLKGDVHSQLSGLRDKIISAERIQSLLERGVSLGTALEKWQRAGLWVMTRADPDYPIRLKRRLKMESPAVLFGSGSKSLLNKSGVAVIGSRDANDKDLAFTANVGKEIASQGYSIVSGGSRGVDQRAMFSALGNKGSVIGVIADSLLKAVLSAKYRNKIMSGDLVLISSFNPEAGFHVGNAMARNRYIYCLADAAVVINSAAHKGGTWHGAIETLKAKWVPVWVNKNSNPESGNSVLVSKGANLFPDNGFKVMMTITPSTVASSDIKASGPTADREALQTGDMDVKKGYAASFEALPPEQTLTLLWRNLFELFVLKMQEITKEKALTSGEISKGLELEKRLAYTLLNRGVVEGKIKKLAKPARYQVTEQVASLEASPPEQTLTLLWRNLFELFVLKMQEITKEKALTSDEISKDLELEKRLVYELLNCGVVEGKMKKLEKPYRYQTIDNYKQAPLFKS